MKIFAIQIPENLEIVLVYRRTVNLDETCTVLVFGFGKSIERGLIKTWVERENQQSNYQLFN